MPSAPPSPWRVVVVDREPSVHALLARVFRAPEFELTAFSSARAALNRIHEIEVHCVVADTAVDLDADTLLETLRSRDGLDRLPFIVVASDRSDSRLQAALDAGADGYVIKPFPLRELLGKVRALLRGQAGDSVTQALPHVVRAAGAPASAAGEPPPVRLEVARSAPAASPAAEPPPADRQQAEPSAQRQASPNDGLGRFTRVQNGTRSIVVLTEASQQPRFVITTVITEKGRALRKIETELPHALAREEDRDLVRQQIDLQHEHALQHLKLLVLDQKHRRVLWSRERIE